MRNIITISILMAVLFVLMGCGFGSKPMMPVQESKQYDLSGDFSGEGEIFATSEIAKITELQIARDKKNEIVAQRETLETEMNDLTHHEGEAVKDCDQCVLNTEDLDSLNKEVETLAGLEELVDLKITSLQFNILKNEDNAVLEMNELVIVTDKDVKAVLDDPDTDEDEAKQRQFYFGDLNKMTVSPIFLFDKNTGKFAFSLTLEVEGESRIYNFSGETLESFVDKKETQKKITLKGDIEVVIVAEGEEAKTLERGKFEVSQIVDSSEKIEDKVSE